jgi:hypothetical protein
MFLSLDRVPADKLGSTSQVNKLLNDYSNTTKLESRLSRLRSKGNPQTKKPERNSRSTSATDISPLPCSSTRTNQNSPKLENVWLRILMILLLDELSKRQLEIMEKLWKLNGRLGETLVSSVVSIRERVAI